MTPIKVFVAAEGNEFMHDIASWIVEACALGGRVASLVRTELPRADGTINLVVAPHEFFELFDAPRDELQEAVRHSVCISTEQPGTPWFELAVDACRRAQFVLDINVAAVEEFERRGIPARHLQLGAVPSMDRSTPDAARPIDVLFMGGLDDRRGAVLAGLASELSRWQVELRLFPFDRPVTTATPGVLFGADKYDLLASAKVLLNVHRGGRDDPDARPYFEWARMVEAMANRCVVVSEPSALHEPLRSGVEFVSAPVRDLGRALVAALGEPRRREFAEAGHRAVTGELSLATSLPALLSSLESNRTIGPTAATQVVRSSDRWLLGASHRPTPIRLGPLRPVGEQRRTAKALALADTRMIRRLDQVASILHTGRARPVERIATPAVGSGPSPRVSAIVTLYDYGDVIEQALTSLIASTDVDFEIVVVDDHSNDDGRRVVRDVMTRHPAVPITLLAKDVNEGLAAARNDAVSAAVGHHVFVMDADNQVVPRCLAELSRTLDEHPAAAAAYSILEDFGLEPGLRSTFAWDPARLCESNYIDAQAMWRRDALRRLGGFRDDEVVHGWEDWDLWLRLAAQGGEAVICRQVLGRYRVQTQSMISLTNLDTDDAVTALRARYPGLPWPEATTLDG